jgi:hypothetical protein
VLNVPLHVRHVGSQHLVPTNTNGARQLKHCISKYPLHVRHEASQQYPLSKCLVPAHEVH